MKNNKILRETLLDKLFTIYKFEFEGVEDKMKRIADRAMCVDGKSIEHVAEHGK